MSFSRFWRKIEGLLKSAALLLIKGYQLFWSPYLGRRCRFEPSCSEYARLSISKFNFFEGALKSLLRIVRCHPFAKGGSDPVSS